MLIGTDLARELRDVVTRLNPTGAAIVTDSNARPYANKVAKAIKRAGLKTAIYAIPAGERSKSMRELEGVLSFLERQQVDRGGCVIAVGGGTVVGLPNHGICCQESERSIGAAAMSRSIGASRIGNLFRMVLICRICRICQRFAL